MLSALAQPTRLAAFRLLMQHEPSGVPAGEIARQIGVPHNTLSTHLSLLQQAGVVSSSRQSRSIVYRVQTANVRQLLAFVLMDCCGGHEDICKPLLAALSQCCDSNQRVMR